MVPGCLAELCGMEMGGQLIPGIPRKLEPHTFLLGVLIFPTAGKFSFFRKLFLFSTPMKGIRVDRKKKLKEKEREKREKRERENLPGPCA